MTVVAAVYEAGETAAIRTGPNFDCWTAPGHPAKKLKTDRTGTPAQNLQSDLTGPTGEKAPDPTGLTGQNTEPDRVDGESTEPDSADWRGSTRPDRTKYIFFRTGSDSICFAPDPTGPGRLALVWCPVRSVPVRMPGKHPRATESATHETNLKK